MSRKECIVIVDDDKDTCNLLAELVDSWGMRAESVFNPSCVCDLKGLCPDIFLLDLNMPGLNGLDLIPDLTLRFGDAKIIIITGCADKDSAIKALKLGAFDFLEKPVKSELLQHSITRALEAQRKERDIRQLVEDLKHSKAELLAHNEKMERLNRRLFDTNKAFSLLARNIDAEREEMERRVAQQITSIVLPTITKLRREKELAKYALELDLLTRTLEDLTAGMGSDAQMACVLSSTELRVASLIKNGMTTEEIADQLYISASTVRTHRKNIRRKLRINNNSYSLKNFLLSKADHIRKPE